MACDLETSPQYNIYGWWPSEGQPSVLIFSTMELGLAPKGIDTDRAIANAIVAGIAGHLMDGGSHERGPRDCPKYLNPKRELELLVGRQTFCKHCKAKLGGHPRELLALNAILRAFD